MRLSHPNTESWVGWCNRLEATFYVRFLHVSIHIAAHNLSVDCPDNSVRSCSWYATCQPLVVRGLLAEYICDSHGIVGFFYRD